VIIKGDPVGGARRLATHLTRTDTNERVEIHEITGVVAEDLRGALLEIAAVASGTRTKKPFYHATINTPLEERLTDEQRAHAIDRLAEKLGLSGQPRMIVVHEKKDREHCHIVWSRIDLDRMAAVSDSHNYRKHEQVARDLEREFGHERVQGAHIEREGRPRPKRTPSHVEMLQVERGAVRPEEAKAFVTDLWQRTDSGQSFKQALEERDWVLARGDRRDFVLIDPNGGTHSLARRVEGAKAKDIRERMEDVHPESLPSVAEARVIQRERQSRQQLPAPEVSPDGAATSASKKRESEQERTLSPLEWTDRGGMVAQQQSANDALRRGARIMSPAESKIERTAKKREPQDTRAAKAPPVSRDTTIAHGKVSPGTRAEWRAAREKFTRELDDDRGPADGNDRGRGRGRTRDDGERSR
jgi:hypothetical protein